MASQKTPNDAWKKKDGTLIPIAEMTDSHLQNAIAYYERKSAEHNELYDTAWNAAASLRGEMAVDQAMSVAMQMAPHNLDEDPKYMALVHEQAKRRVSR